MSKPAEISFTKNLEVFKQQLESINLKECDLLVLINIPSIAAGSKLLSKDWFKSTIVNQPNIYGICLKINDGIGDKFDRSIYLNSFAAKESIVVSFQSAVDECKSKIYWKVKRHEKFYFLDIDEDKAGELSKFCLEFLINELKNGRIGIPEKLSHKSKIRLQEIKNSNNKNLLVLATSKIQLNIVKKLIENDFDADDAIDAAWQLYFDDKSNENVKQEVNKIILCLLNANSKLPDDFDYDKASQEVREFIRKCESLHSDVDDDNFDSLKLKLESEPNLIHFYNRHNESLLAHSLKTKKFKIFELLNKEITTGSDENLDKVYENMEKKERGMLRDQHKANAKEFPEVHILILRSKCKIGNNDKLSHKKWKYIDEALEVLNSNDYCKKILKVAAEFKKLKIYFDFKHDSTYYMDPATSIYSKGIIYEGGSIFIGAKFLPHDEMKFAVFGVLAHELCHLAVFMAFMNRNFDPFALGESDQKTRFIDQVMVQCKERAGAEGIVANVFVSYPKDVQESEMIVTVPQMLMHYIRNPTKIQELEATFEELFRYSREVVEPELDRALPIFKSLRDNSKSYKFEALTEPMKTKILHSKIKFQGTETSFNELVGNDQKTLNLLTPEDICGILIKNSKPKIGNICKPTLEYEFSERNYIKTELYDKICKNDRSNREKMDIESEVKSKQETFDGIKAEAEKSKVFLLVDHAGTGKTTSLEDIALKLKKSCGSSWVSFINLRDHIKSFEPFKLRSKLNVVEVLKILLKCVNQKTEIEVRIFTHLFLTGKLVLLFDGVDEISPKFTDQIEKVFQFLRKSSSKNQLWVSSRPHYSKKLQNILNCSAYKFAPYTEAGKRIYIQNILKTKNIQDSQRVKLTNDIENLLFQLDIGLVSTKEVDNSLMIKIATELFAENGIDSKIKGNYSIHLAMFEMQVEKLGKKVDEADKILQQKLSIINIFEVLALKVIIEDNYKEMLNFKLDELVIMKKWNNLKNKFTSDMIQRLGFVHVDLNNLDQEGSINFMHRTYAEFFVAKFLIDSLFDDNFDDSDEEIERKCQILDIACRNSMGDFIRVCFFISSNLNNESKGKVFHEKVREFLVKKIIEIHKEISINDINVVDTFGSYAKILSTDRSLTNKLWKTGNENNVLKHLIFKFYNKNYIKFTYFADISFGSKWHEILSGKQLITIEEIENLHEDGEKEGEWNYCRFLVKICDLVDQCYTKDEKFKFYNNVDLDCITNTKVRLNIIPRLGKFADGTQFMEECLAEICVRVISIESLTFVINQFEIALNINKELIRKVLSKYILKILHNVYDSKESGIFELIRKFFMKYFTKLEIQDYMTHMTSIIIDKDSFNIFEGTEHLFYNEYKKFIIDIFGPSDYSKLIKIIEFFCLTKSTFKVALQKVYDNIYDLLLLIYSNNSGRVDYVFESIIKSDF